MSSLIKKKRAEKAIFATGAQEKPVTINDEEEEVFHDFQEEAPTTEW